MIILEIFDGRISLNSVPLLLSVYIPDVYIPHVYIPHAGVYISHRKYQIKPHSSPWFSAVYTTAIVHRNRFFRLDHQNKCSESKVKLRQWSNGIVVKALDSISRGPVFKTSGWLQGRLSLSPFRGR